MRCASLCPAGDGRPPHAQEEHWPYSIDQKQNLALARGDVFLIKSVRYAVVGYNGRELAYICWRADPGHRFDIARYELVERNKAHSCPCDPAARMLVPPLPPLDCRGRPAGDTTVGSPQSSQRCSRTTSPATSPKVMSSPPDARCASLHRSRPPLPSAETPPQLRSQDARWSGTLLTSPRQPELGPLTAAEVVKDLKFEHGPESCRTVGPSSTSLQRDVAVADEQLCVLSSVCRSLFASVGRRLQLVSTRLLSAAQQPQCSCPQLACTRVFGAPSEQGGGASSGSTAARVSAEEAVANPVGAAAQGLHITIPIVRPACWREVQHLLEGQCATFDERGWKETMAVRPERWCLFVDRQRARLQRELDAIRAAEGTSAAPVPPCPALPEPVAAKLRPSLGRAGDEEAALPRSLPRTPSRPPLTSPAAPGGSAAGRRAGPPRPWPPQPDLEQLDFTSTPHRWPPESTITPPRLRGGAQEFENAASMALRGSFSHEDEFVDIEHMVSRMEDWKDLRRYAGRAISMVPTQRAHEMRIHVTAFAQQADGGDIDFVQVSYRKAVVLRAGAPRPRFGLAELVPFLDSQVVADTPEELWEHLAKQPDVAKFAIALVFRKALACDGIHLIFCDRSLNDEE